MSFYEILTTEGLGRQISLILDKIKRGIQRNETILNNRQYGIAYVDGVVL